MNRDQSLVVLAGVPVFALTVGAFAARPFLPSEFWLTDRLRLGAGCAALIALPLLFAIWRVALFRFVSDADRPGAGLAPAPGAALRVHQAVLQNTLEQTLLAAIAYLAFAATARVGLLPLLPLFAGLFLLGRVAFALGYRFGAPGRAFGFGLTIAPTVTLYVLMGLSLLAP